jgi:hypothetical protein
MTILTAINAITVLQVLANKEAAHRLQTACDTRVVLYPLLNARAALDGGHRCVRSCICPVVAP